MRVSHYVAGATHRRAAGTLAVIVGATVCLYCLWTAHRFGGPWPADWPRAFPYPDHWLQSLNDYYDPSIH